MTDQVIEFSTVVSSIILLSQVLKHCFNIKAKYIPLINMILGILSIRLALGHWDIWQGMIIGASASGFYDICYQALKKEGEERENNENH